MAPPWVVEELDVIEHIRTCLCPICVDLPLDPLTLAQLKEALGDRVSVVVVTPTHAQYQSVRLQEGINDHAPRVQASSGCGLGFKVRVDEGSIHDLRLFVTPQTGKPVIA